MLLLLGLLGMHLLHEAGVIRQQARSITGVLQAPAATDGATRRVILDFLDPRDPLRWPLDSTRRSITLFGRSIQVQVARRRARST